MRGGEAAEAAAAADRGFVVVQKKCRCLHIIVDSCSNGGDRTCVEPCGTDHVPHSDDASCSGSDPNLPCNSRRQQQCDAYESAELRYDRIREAADPGVQRLLHKTTKTRLQRSRTHPG